MNVKPTTHIAPAATHQGGFFLIEALIAILIFSLGVLGLVAMGGAAIAAQSDAQYRTEAAALADEIASKISLNVDRLNAANAYPSTAASIAATLAPYQHQPNGVNCAFNGDASTDPTVQAWVTKVSAPRTGLPGATATSQQIRIDTANFNRITVTICWQAPQDRAMRQHTLVTYVN
ncbi:MAG TPA: type IV pilus modification protein PilV [Candidatus Margulisiibacteriota bacterium]|nr:type IV pilus modification protein PilV [Candidatus Margulisiibacteriota bacterium]